MGKKNRKKTTWTKLSLEVDDSTTGSSDGRGRSSSKSVDDSCHCQNGRNSRFNSMTVKKSFLSSRKFRQYPPYHASDFNGGLIGNGADDSSNSSYTANDESVYGEDQQQQQQQQQTLYFQPPFAYPCFITPTLLLPPYHPSQWYEDPRLPYDPQNFICLTQPLTPPPYQQNNTSSINSCSSPETESEVGYTSSSPPAANRVSDSVQDEEQQQVLNDGLLNDDQPFLHQVPGVLQEDQTATSPPYFYPGTTYVLKPFAVMRRHPQDGWWDNNDYGGSSGSGSGLGLGRRRRRRGFIGGEGITYDRWPSRVPKENYRADEYQSHIMQDNTGDQLRLSEHLQQTDNQQQQRVESSHNEEDEDEEEEDSALVSIREQIVDGTTECQQSGLVEVKEEEEECPEVVTQVRMQGGVETAAAEELSTDPVPQQQQPSLDDTLTTCHDPLGYTKYYQICGVDDLELEEEEEETKEEEVEEELKEEEEEPKDDVVMVVMVADTLELSTPRENEIVVHEVEGSSGASSECGSEDVETLGHRYESGAEKLYKSSQISLAAELLDTNQPLPYDLHLKSLMERSKSMPFTTTTGYVSNTRHVMENYCSHLAVRHPPGTKTLYSNPLDEVDDVDIADVAEDQTIFSPTEVNVIRAHTGISPFTFLRTKGPWHGCCCSIM